MPNRVIVLGVMRSGTSLTAELIRVWGAYAGSENELWKSDINDPRGYGYMEYIPLQNFNDELLDNNDRVPPPHQLLEEKASDPIFREKALKLLQDMDEQAAQNNFDTWVWKDARLPLTLPFWVKFLKNPIYVITIRHPAEVALSSAKTEDFSQDNLPFSAGFVYWQHCMLNILSATEESQSKMFIAYEQLIDNTLRECTRLCHFLDENCGKSAEHSQERIEAMRTQVSGGQRHHHYGKALAEMEQATREQRALYNFLRVKTMHPDEVFLKDDFAPYPGWREYLQAMDMIITLSKSFPADDGL
jgi:hypothetical protein